MYNNCSRVAAISGLLALLFSPSASAGLYTYNYSDSGAIPQGGTVFSAAHGITGIPTSISSIELILTFNDSSSLLGNSTGIEGHLVLGTGTGSPYVDFYPVNNTGSGGTYVYDATFSGTSGSPGIGFNGLDPNATWGLVLWDHGTSGFENGLVGWSLDITAVPEPVNVALGIFASLLVVVLVARTRPVRIWAHRRWVGFNQWLDAV